MFCCESTAVGQNSDGRKKQISLSLYIYIHSHFGSSLQVRSCCFFGALTSLNHGGVRCLWWRLFLVVTLAMPHCRSVADLARRSDRALTLNYVRPRAMDRAHVAVPKALAKSFKMVAKSMIYHAVHDTKAGGDASLPCSVGNPWGRSLTG